MPNTKKLSNEEIDKVVELYQNGKSATEISDYYGLSNNTICSYLEERGVSRRKGGGRKLTDNQIDSICEKYKNGISGTKLANKYNVNDKTIYKYLERKEIERREREEANREYNVDESAFNEITEHSAYWIGFLMADGCVHQRSNSSPKIILGLAKKDKPHLENFKKFLNADYPIKEKLIFNDTEAVEIRITSQKLVDCLNDFGVVPRKTEEAKVMGGLKRNKHFWRGVVDGDGCLGIYNDKPEISLCGAKLLLTQFKEFVISFCGTKANVRESKGSYSYKVQGKFAPQVIKKLYQDSNVYLDRKKKIADEIIKEYG